jgi:hypothetical protein
LDVLIINGHDYSGYVARRGYGWSREDLDSDKTTRTKDGTLRRDKIAEKRKLSYTMLDMSRELLAQLDQDLSAATFSVTYMDLHGRYTKTFYCSSFSVTLAETYGDESVWEDASFNITEV